MKIYQWSFKGKTGTVTAANTKEAKTLLVAILRDKGDKSTRVPKGTTIKKIGLTKTKAAPTVVSARIEKPVEKPAHSHHVTEINYEKAAKAVTLTNCGVQIKGAGYCYIGEGCDLVLPRGTEYCKTVIW